MSDHGQGGGWLDDPRNVDRLLRVFYVLCALTIAAELLIHKHAEHPAESWFGFHGLYGFAGIVVLVLLSKLLRRLVMRSEDYYDA